MMEAPDHDDAIRGFTKEKRIREAVKQRASHIAENETVRQRVHDNAHLG